MPLPPAHGLIGLAAAYCLRPARDQTRELQFVLFMGILSVLPDFDVFVGLIWTGHLWTYHRAASHSLAFSALVGMLLVCARHLWCVLSWRELFRYWALYSGVLVVHVLLDAVWPRYGIMLLWPFSDAIVLGPDLSFRQYVRTLPGELSFEFLIGGIALYLALKLNWRRLRMRDRLIGLVPAPQPVRTKTD